MVVYLCGEWGLRTKEVVTGWWGRVVLLLVRTWVWVFGRVSGFVFFLWSDGKVVGCVDLWSRLVWILIIVDVVISVVVAAVVIGGKVERVDCKSQPLLTAEQSAWCSALVLLNAM